MKYTRWWCWCGLWSKQLTPTFVSVALSLSTWTKMSGLLTEKDGVTLESSWPRPPSPAPPSLVSVFWLLFPSTWPSVLVSTLSLFKNCSQIYIVLNIHDETLIGDDSNHASGDNHCNDVYHWIWTHVYDSLVHHHQHPQNTHFHDASLNTTCICCLFYICRTRKSFERKKNI